MRPKILLFVMAPLLVTPLSAQEGETDWVEYNLVPDSNASLCVRRDDKLFCPRSVPLIRVMARNIFDPTTIRELDRLQQVNRPFEDQPDHN